jgi:hypothetical protein
MVKIILDIPITAIREGKDLVIKVDSNGNGHISSDEKGCSNDKDKLFAFMSSVIKELSKNGHNRTAETYSSTLWSW